MSDGCIVIVPGGPPRDVCESAASTSTTLPFTQPAVGADVAVNVGATDWISSGQVLFVEGGGYYTAVPSTATEVRLTNLGYTGNAAPGAVINPPQLVSPGGLQGPAVTYQITYKPGGVAVPGQVYTTDASLRTAIASLLAAGGAVTVFLDGSANGNAVAFTDTTHTDWKNKVRFVALDWASGTSRVACSTANNVQFQGLVGIEGGAWTFNTTSGPSIVPSNGVMFFRFSGYAAFDASAANPALSLVGALVARIEIDQAFLGGFSANPVIGTGAATAVFNLSNQGQIASATAINGTGNIVVVFNDASAKYLSQTTLIGAGGTEKVIYPTSTWQSTFSYPVEASVEYNGVIYKALAGNNTNKQPDTQPAFWKPISRQRYSNAGAALWYQLTGAGPYANGGTAGVEAMTSSAGVLENQPGPFATAPVIPTGERIRTATSTKNPAAAAATVWAWCRPGVVTAEALLWGKLVDASDVTASIRIGFTAAGLPTASIRRTGQPADDTATAGAEHTLGAGQMVLIAATYDGANLRLYVNGELAATTAAAGTLANTALSSWIAGATLGGLTPFVGKLDEVGMDNTVYPQATLAKMAAAGLAWLS